MEGEQLHPLNTGEIPEQAAQLVQMGLGQGCLLYTSDAATKA